MSARSGSPSPEELLAHAGRLRRLAVRLAGEGEADDLVQEAWLAALRRPPRGGPLGPWLARVLANRAKNRRRDEARRRERELERASGGEAPAPEEIALELETQRTLVEAVLALPEPERSLVTLRWFHELDSPAIGARLGMPAATVRWRLARAMAELRARLDARFGGSREAWAALLAPASLGTAKGAATALQGALAMSGLAKLGAAAAAVALAGWAWLGWERSERATTSDTAMRTEEVGAIDDEPLLEPAESSQAAPSEAPQRVALEGSTEEAAAAPPIEPASPPPLPARVTAVIVDEARRPLARATLFAVPDRSTSSSESDATGAVELEVTPRHRWGWEQQLAVRRAGFAELHLAAVLEPGEATPLGELALEPGGAVRGRVVDEHGRAVEGARVRTLAAELPRGVLDHRRLHGFDEVPGPETTSGIDGGFLLDGLPAGPLRLWAKADSTRHGWTEPLEIVAGETLADALVVAERWRREDRILGRVVDPDGRPVSGAQVVAHATCGRSSGGRSLETDENGRFELVAICDGPHELSAADPEDRFGAVGARDVPLGTEDLELRLVARRTLVVRVLGAKGQPLESYSDGVRFANGSQAVLNGIGVHPEGVVRISPPGLPFLVEIGAIGYQRQLLGPFEPDDLPPELVVELERPPAIAGIVTADGEPVAAATVRLWRPHPAWNALVDGFASQRVGTSFSAVTGADGRFHLPVEVEGEFVVRAEAPERAAAELGPLALRLGALPGDLVLELPIGGVLEGTVLLPDGRDPTGTIVGLNRGDGRPRTQRVGPDGRFRFESLTPGSYELSRRDEELEPNTSTSSVGGERHAFSPTCEWSDAEIMGMFLGLSGPARAHGYRWALYAGGHPDRAERL